MRACAWVRACVSFCVLPRPNSTWPPTRINPPAQVDRVRAAHPWPLAGLPSSLLRWGRGACGQRGGRRQGRLVEERAAASSSSRPLGCCNGGSTDETTLADDDDRGAGGRVRRSFGRRVGLVPWVVLAAAFSPSAPHTNTRPHGASTSHNRQMNARGPSAIADFVPRRSRLPPTAPPSTHSTPRRRSPPDASGKRVGSGDQGGG